MCSTRWHISCTLITVVFVSAEHDWDDELLRDSSCLIMGALHRTGSGSGSALFFVAWTACCVLTNLDKGYFGHLYDTASTTWKRRNVSSSPKNDSSVSSNVPVTHSEKKMMLRFAAMLFEQEKPGLLGHFSICRRPCLYIRHYM